MSRIPPVEALFHNEFAAAARGPMVQPLLTSAALQPVLISYTFLLHFVGTSEMDVLHTLDLQRKKVNIAYRQCCILECATNLQHSLRRSFTEVLLHSLVLGTIRLQHKRLQIFSIGHVVPGQRKHKV